jgi:radical SAM protein with 4Fe4S-binding SPASM domain
MDELVSLVDKARQLLNNSVFRFLDELGYGIDYKKNKYYFLDEIGTRIVRDIVESGSIDIDNIAELYGVPSSLVFDDTILFLRQLTEATGINSSGLPSSQGMQDEVFFKYFTERRIPLSAIIEITNKCNEHCIHCYRPAAKKEVWRTDLFERVCSELKEMGTLQLDFTGGEPFLKKNFLEFLQIADKYGFIISILTNATLIDEKAIEILNSLRIRNIYISIYSSSPYVHDKITGLPGSFEKTLNAIKTLLANKIQISLNSSVMTENRHSTSGTKELADSLGVDIKFAYKISKSYNKSILTNELNVFSKSELSRLIDDPQIRLYADIIESKKSGRIIARDRERSCDAGFRSITISPEGEIIPCTALRLKCGNILNEKLSELWENNKNIKYWRDKGSLINEQCKCCSAYDYCEPCPAGYFADFGSLEGIDETTCGFGKVFSSCISCS